jgi:hypothetical protein
MVKRTYEVSLVEFQAKSNHLQPSLCIYGHCMTEDRTIGIRHSSSATRTTAKGMSEAASEWRAES